MRNRLKIDRQEEQVAKVKWVLIPGLGVDHRYFANIIDLLPDLQVLEFEEPRTGETIEDYAERFRCQIHADGPIVLGGVSFGGMLASILCRQVDPVALVLMSSTPRPDGLGYCVRVFEWMTRSWPATLVGWVRSLGNRALQRLEPLPPDQVENFNAMFGVADLKHIRAGGRMIMEWAEPPQISCPRFHIHGSRDPLMPAGKVGATHIVQGAGHMMNLTHPDELRNFIREVHCRLEDGLPDSNP